MLANYQSPEFSKRYLNIQSTELGGQRKIGLLIRSILKAGWEVKVVSSAPTRDKRLKIQKHFRTDVVLKEGTIEVFHPVGLTFKVLSGLLQCITAPLLSSKITRKWNPDIIITYNGLFAEAIGSLYCNARYKTPFVAEIDDLPDARSRGWNPKPILDKSTWPLFLKKCSGFILVNSELKKYFDLKKKTNIILPGIVDDELIELSKARNDLFSNHKKELLYSGTLKIERGIDILISSIEYMPPDWKLIVTGSGKDEEHIVQASKIFPNKINFLGKLELHELFKKMCSVDAVINTPESISCLNAVFPFKIFEYIASRSHVISTELPCIEGVDLKWFQRWSGCKKEITKILSSAKEDYFKESEKRERTIKWVIDNFSLNQASNILSAYFQHIVKILK